MRLLVADDHPLFRLGLKAALEAEGLEVVAEAGTGEEAWFAPALPKRWPIPPPALPGSIFDRN